MNTNLLCVSNSFPSIAENYRISTSFVYKGEKQCVFSAFISNNNTSATVFLSIYPISNSENLASPNRLFNISASLTASSSSQITITINFGSALIVGRSYVAIVSDTNNPNQGVSYNITAGEISLGG
jgi:hypothetical protein